VEDRRREVEELFAGYEARVNAALGRSNSAPQSRRFSNVRGA
jgi:hypothetical protein